MSEERLDAIRDSHAHHNDLDRCGICFLLDTIERLTATSTYPRPASYVCPACGDQTIVKGLCGRCVEAGYEALKLFDVSSVLNRAIGNISEEVE